MILSLLFSLDVDKITRLKHYCSNVDRSGFDMAAIDLNTTFYTLAGRFDARIEKIDIAIDSVTQNANFTMHVHDKEGIEAQMRKDNIYYHLDMKYSPRTKKVSFVVHYDGCKAH